jgi:mannose-6-phosphate isomerase-like protein (cupin superfamily)
MRAKTIMLAGLVALATPGVAMAQNNQVESQASFSEADIDKAEMILRDYADDYVNDPMALDASFGIKLGPQWWNVTVARKETPSQRGRLTDHSFGPHDVTLTRGAPTSPTWYFEIASLDVLEKIASGEVNAGTAAMQSFGSDRVGVETRDMEGFKSTSGDEADRYIALAHFFTKGRPEVIRFGRDKALQTHGVQATAIHMVKAARILHFSINRDEAANDSEQLEASQTPNLFIVTHGRGTVESDDGVIPVEPGVAVYVPQFTKHVIRNDGGEPLEGILILYGDNSDFAFGTSFPTYVQDLNEWHRNYDFRKGQPTSEGDE